MNDPDVLTAEDLALIADPDFYRTCKPLVARLAVAVLEYRRREQEPPEARVEVAVLEYRRREQEPPEARVEAVNAAIGDLPADALLDALRQRGLVVELHVFDMGPPIGLDPQPDARAR